MFETPSYYIVSKRVLISSVSKFCHEVNVPPKNRIMLIHFRASLLIARGISIYTNIFSVRIIYRATDALLLPKGASCLPKLRLTTATHSSQCLEAFHCSSAVSGWWSIATWAPLLPKG